MPTQDLTALIAASPLLTAQEKAYWRENLPHMDDGQKDRLRGILDRAAKVPWTQTIGRAFGAIGAAAQAHLHKHP